jgi:hypothetical protein
MSGEVEVEVCRQDSRARVVVSRVEVEVCRQDSRSRVVVSRVEGRTRIHVTVLLLGIADAA